MTEQHGWQGLDAYKATLAGIVPKLRRRALRNALSAGARVVRDAARQNRRASSAGSPVTGNEVRNYTRGSVAKAISVRNSKNAAHAGDVGVFVNVRPMKKGNTSRFGPVRGAGRKNPDDPFYWRWLEFGAPKIHVGARAFLQPAASRLLDALRIFEKTIGPQIQKLDTNPKDPL